MQEMAHVIVLRNVKTNLVKLLEVVLLGKSLCITEKLAKYNLQTSFFKRIIKLSMYISALECAVYLFMRQVDPQSHKTAATYAI